ncbi:DUF779 domain-containing protein [Streptomyces sp. NPDC059467]|uniref:DUF779 domain-containing protein n=1 Tax=Streptomyces sp. NPDC059467 TaxID=3346844 RepID=UPI003680A5C6
MTANAENGTAGRVTVTRAARKAIEALRAALGGPVMFVQFAGCCDGSDPMCFPDGEFALGDGDMLVGVVHGCTFHMNADQYEALGRPLLVLDTEPGTPGGFSLAAGDGLRFVTRIKAPQRQRS